MSQVIYQLQIIQLTGDIHYSPHPTPLVSTSSKFWTLPQLHHHHHHLKSTITTIIVGTTSNLQPHQLHLKSIITTITNSISNKSTISKYIETTYGNLPLDHYQLKCWTIANCSATTSDLQFYIKRGLHHGHRSPCNRSI